MSKLEDAAKPIISAMMAGAIFEITPDMQRNLAAWATKVSMMAEYLEKGVGVVPPAERQQFRLTGVPPEGWYIYAAGYEGLSWRELNLYQQRLHLAEKMSAEPDAPLHHFSLTAFGVVDAAFFVYSASGPRAREVCGAYDSIALRRIWPLSGRSLLWPPLVTYGDADVNRLANALNTDDPAHLFDPDQFRIRR